MIGPPGKGAARRAMADRIPESDIDRLLSAARTPAPASHTGFSDDDPQDPGLDGPVHMRAMAPMPSGPAVTMWDIPIFILYACLGVFTRIWTEITLYFDFGGDDGFRMFALGVVVALHVFIVVIIASAWRAQWRFRARNLTAIAALAGYLGCRMVIQL